MKKELDEKIIKSVVDIYMSPSISFTRYKFMEEFGFGYKTAKKIINDNVDKYPIKNRDEVNFLYSKYPNINEFSKHADIPNIQKVTTYLLHLVATKDYLKKLFVDDGLSYVEIADKIDMPFVDNEVIGAVIKKLGYKQDKEVEDIRIKRTVKKSHLKIDTISARNKREATNLERYGTKYPSQLKEFKFKQEKTNLNRYGSKSYLSSADNKESRYYNLDFNPKIDIESYENSLLIIKNKFLLSSLLGKSFPEKKSFTLSEISGIMGIKYNTVKSIIQVDSDFIVHDYNPKGIHLWIKNYLVSLGYSYKEDFYTDRKILGGREIDFYFPKERLGIEVNDLLTHNSTINPLGGEPKPKKYHMEKSRDCKEKGIRLIHVWEHYLQDDRQRPIILNAIKHALGRSSARVYARNTYVKEVSNISLKGFFNTNNIQGFRGANRAYALLDKHTDEVLMAYSVGSSHFAHNKYDLELIRGASKLDTTVVGGASKLWKYIIDNNPEVNSIVYYIDRNIYSGSSIGSLEGNLELVSTQEGFWNYFPSTGEIKNRQPSKHKEIKELISQGKVWEVYNAGTETYVWKR